MVFELLDNPRPVNAAFAGKEMGIPITKIVTDVDHLEMTGKLVEYAVQITTQPSMPGVEASADGTGLNLTKQKQHVTDISEEQMGQHVFQQQMHSNLATKCGDAVERYCGALHPLEKLFLRRTPGALRPRV